METLIKYFREWLESNHYKKWSVIIINIIIFIIGISLIAFSYYSKQIDKDYSIAVLNIGYNVILLSSIIAFLVIIAQGKTIIEIETKNNAEKIVSIFDKENKSLTRKEIIDKLIKNKIKINESSILPSDYIVGSKWSNYEYLEKDKDNKYKLSSRGIEKWEELKEKDKNKKK